MERRKKEQAYDQDVVDGEVLSELSELEEVDERSVPTVYTQLKTSSRSSSEAGSFHTRGQPLNINSQDFVTNGGSLSSESVPESWDCLASHPRLPWALRFGLPVLDLALICLFM